jgi:hypothetical protein
MKAFLSGIWWIKVRTVILAALLAGVLTACGGVSGSVGTSNVTVKVGDGTVRSGKALAAIPTNVAGIRFTISAADITTIIRTISVAGQTAVIESFDVPSGNDRLFVVEALDASGGVLYRGQTYANLTGSSVSLSISISASNATITITTDSGGKTTTTRTLSSAMAQVTIPAGTTLTDASGNPLTGELTATSTFSSSVSTLPTAAAILPTGQNLAAYIDLNISAGGISVKNINPGITVVLNAGSGVVAGDKVSIFSFDSASGAWRYEAAAVVNTDGTVQFTVSHLSIWGVFKSAGTATVTLTLSSLPTGTTANGAELTVTLPAGVTVSADSVGTVSSSSIAVSGVAPTGSSVAGRYSAATNSVMLSVISSNSFSTGEFMTLTCSIAPGTILNANGFTVSGFTAFDANGVAITGATGSLQTTFK